MAKTPAERRKHKRHEVTCPATLTQEDGRIIAAGKTANISDGGVFFFTSAGDLTTLDGRMILKLAVPRKTANTYMLEDFSLPVRVVRRQQTYGPKLIGIALEFATPADLGLEV